MQSKILQAHFHSGNQMSSIYPDSGKDAFTGLGRGFGVRVDAVHAHGSLPLSAVKFSVPSKIADHVLKP